jgi:uncharacterized membrane protein YciS (DUF1049 family)
MNDFEVFGLASATFITGLILGAILVFHWWEKERKRENRLLLEAKVHIANLQHKLKELKYQPAYSTDVRFKALDKLEDIEATRAEMEKRAEKYTKSDCAGGADPK